MLHISQEMGFIQDFTIDGELPVIEPFQLPEAAQIDFMTKIPKGIRRPVKKIIDGILRPVPKIDEQICVGCGKMRRKLSAAHNRDCSWKGIDSSQEMH